MKRYWRYELQTLSVTQWWCQQARFSYQQTISVGINALSFRTAMLKALLSEVQFATQDNFSAVGAWRIVERSRLNGQLQLIQKQYVGVSQQRRTNGCFIPYIFKRGNRYCLHFRLPAGCFLRRSEKSPLRYVVLCENRVYRSA